MGKKQPYAGRIGYYQTIDPLPKDVENGLIRQAQAGDTAARDRVIAANMRWAIKTAVEYCGPQVDLEDLIQEAAFGLVTALEKFDPERGFGFLSYARHWISQRLSHYVKSHSRTVRIPFNQQDVRRQINAEAERADQEKGCHVDTGLVVERLELHDARAAELYELWQRDCTSLDQLIEEHHTLTPIPKSANSRLRGTTLLERQADPTAVDPLQRLIDQETTEKIHRLLRRLNERERYILLRYWSLHPDHYGHRCTLQEIADDLGITRERVRQIKERALCELNKRRRKNRYE